MSYFLLGKDEYSFIHSFSHTLFLWERSRGQPPQEDSKRLSVHSNLKYFCWLPRTTTVSHRIWNHSIWSLVNSGPLSSPRFFWGILLTWPHITVEIFLFGRVVTQHSWFHSCALCREVSRHEFFTKILSRSATCTWDSTLSCITQYSWP